MTQQLYGTIGLKNISTKSQYFWMLSTASGSTPAGIYVTEVTKDSFESNHTGHNLYMNSNGIYMRKGLYNQIVLQTATTNGEGPYLRLYVPSGSSQGKLSVELDGSESTLRLYEMETGNTNTLAATLNANGLKLLHGGIEGGEYSTTTNNFIYLSTEDYDTAIEINGRAPASNAIDWRLIVGNKFGVTNAGALYAADVNVKGIIKADTGYIGGTTGWTITSNQLYNNTFGSNGSMYLSTTNLSGTIADTTITNGEADGTDTTVTTRGWRLTVGSNFGVTSLGQLYAKGAEINGAITATTLSTNGRTSKNDGLAGVYMDSTGNIYAGGYTSGSNKYNKFYVEGSNLYLNGEEITNIIQHIADAATTATNFISGNSNGIKISSYGSNTNYTWIDDNGVSIYSGGIDVAQFSSVVRIGANTSNHLRVSDGKLSFYNVNTQVGYIMFYNNTSSNLRGISQYVKINDTSYVYFDQSVNTNTGLGHYYIGVNDNDGLMSFNIYSTESYYNVYPGGNILTVKNDGSVYLQESKKRQLHAIFYGTSAPGYNTAASGYSYSADIGDIYIKY